MAEAKLTREKCIKLLKERYSLLLSEGENRYPKRSDFTEREVVAIKAFLGPWPRALEAAGVKPKRDENARLEEIREKRINAKRQRIAALKEKSKKDEEE